MESPRDSIMIVTFLSGTITIVVAFMGIISYIQNGEKRLTQIEVRLEVVSRQMEEVRGLLKDRNGK